jgi:hypothetical protein
MLDQFLAPTRRPTVNEGGERGLWTLDFGSGACPRDGFTHVWFRGCPRPASLSTRELRHAIDHSPRDLVVARHHRVPEAGDANDRRWTPRAASRAKELVGVARIDHPIGEAMNEENGLAYPRRVTQWIL